MGLQTIPSHKAVQKEYCEVLRPVQSCPLCRQGLQEQDVSGVHVFRESVMGE